MASPLFTLLLTGMFGYVMGCLLSLCLHRVSVRVATLCTAGACLASNVKPGSLWNLTKVSTGRGWKFILIWRLQSFLLGHAGVGQGHQKPPFSLRPYSCRMNSKSLKVSVPYIFFAAFIKFQPVCQEQVIKVTFSGHYPVHSNQIHMLEACPHCHAHFFISPLNGADLPQQTGAEWKDFKMRL